MKLLIQNGEIFDGNGLQKADILLEEGKIAALSPQLAAAGAESFDAAGCVVSPGFCDLHVHLREPGFPEKETIASGTAAAAAGGFTTVCTMPNVAPVPDDLHHLEPQLTLIQQNARVQVLPYGSITVGQKGDCLADIEVLADFVAGFSDDGRGVQQDEMMRRALIAAAGAGSFIAAHCEVESLLPPNGVCVQQDCRFAREHGFRGYSNESEWREVQRNIGLVRDIARQEGLRCHLHICHASTEKTFSLVRQAKQEGLSVTCEVTPHNLLLCCDDISDNDGRFKMNPPLRTEADRQAAIEALLDGTVDAIATDHAPHTAAEKAGGFGRAMNGVVGLETAFAALYSGLVLAGVLPLEKLLSLLGAGPRRVLQEKPLRPVPGAEATLTVLDLASARKTQPEEFLSKGHATPFAGCAFKGWPVLTLYKGDSVFKKA